MVRDGEDVLPKRVAGQEANNVNGVNAHAPSVDAPSKMRRVGVSASSLREENLASGKAAMATLGYHEVIDPAMDIDDSDRHRSWSQDQEDAVVDMEDYLTQTAETTGRAPVGSSVPGIKIYVHSPSYDSGVDPGSPTPVNLSSAPPVIPEDPHGGLIEGRVPSRFHISPVVERKISRAGRKISGHSAPGVEEGGLKTGRYQRKISFASDTHPAQQARKISAYSQGSDGSNPVILMPTRKHSNVVIDQQPQIILPPGRFYLDVGQAEDNDDDEEFGSRRHHHDDDVDEPPGEDNFRLKPRRPQRVSVFSYYSTCSHGSYMSDATFCDTHERLPCADHYRDVLPTDEQFQSRPSLKELREQEGGTHKEDVIGNDLEDKPGDLEAGKDETTSTIKSLPKMGWIQGVLIRCVLNIFGVMLFLRLTWITGQAGIGLATVIILLASLVTVITTTSMAAICTNGEVQAGGAYYMISRSLGPQFGGAIGVVFSLANAVGAAMYIVGFAETVRDLMWEYNAYITGHPLHEVRIIGCATAVLLLGIVLIGLDFEAKAQLVLLVILVAAIINYFVGTFLPPPPEAQWKGVVGYRADVLLENMGPDFRGVNFFGVFAIFFPAATGILAGANISGDLKDPSRAIPLGTFLAILIATLTYLGIVWTSGGCMLRDAIGLPVLLANATVEPPSDLDVIRDCGNATCTFGLMHDNGVMGLASAFRPLILAGIFSATLSSALASIVSAPKVFQALCKDKLFPYIHFFGVGDKKTGEPKRGYVLTFFICIAITCIAELDIIAPIISNFFLMAYALINYSCFDASFANSPGFRPGFRWYSQWLSLVGALLCLAIMFLINWWAALVTFVVIASLYVYVHHSKPDVNWGSSSQAHAYNDALKATTKLMDVEEHVKNYRPQILVLTGYPRNRSSLLDFVASITKKQSLLICGHVFLGDLHCHVKRMRSTAAYRWFKQRDVKAFYTSVAAPSLRHGTQYLLETSGIGKLRPNTIMLGFKGDWERDDPRNVHNYAGIIHDAFDLRYAVGILRVPEGFDLHKVTDDLLDSTDETLTSLPQADSSEGEEFSSDEEDAAKTEKASPKEPKPFGRLDSHPKDEGIVLQTFKRTGQDNPGFTASQDDVTREEKSEDKNDKEEKAREDPDQMQAGMKARLRKLESHQAPSYSRFREKQEGTIDVWWLFDDGGLTLLLPYILSKRKQWKGCKLRVFCAGTKRGNLDEDHRRMATLLGKFRINPSQITVVPDLKKKPSKTSYNKFDEIIYPWRLRRGESQADYPWRVANADLLAQKQKTYMKIRLREKLLEHSSAAALVVVTLPVPPKTRCPAGLYMAWLEMLTRDLPPTLLLRGNQQSVLTYFS